MKLSPLTLTRGAVATLACLAICAPLVAEEPPANNSALWASVVADAQADTLYLGNKVLALNIAANTDLIGVELAQVDDVLRSHLGLAEGKGLVVLSVAEGGPAASAGVQKFDVLVIVGGQEIAGLEAFRKALEASPDKPIELGFIRAGKKQATQVTPRTATAVFSDLDLAITSVVEEKYWLGVGLAVADDTLRSQLSLLVGALVVTSVENDSPAAKAGVMVNDVLLKLDGKPLVAVEDLSRQLQEIGDKPVSLELLRRGKPATLTVLAEKHAASQTVTTGQPLSWRVVYPNNLYPNLLLNAYQPQPLDLNAYANAGNPPTNLYAYFTTPGVNDAAYGTLAVAPAKSELAKQIDELEAQLKQLEASLAALRSSLQSTQEQADNGAKSKSKE